MTARPGTAVVTVAHGRHDHLDRQRASLAVEVVVASVGDGHDGGAPQRVAEVVASVVGRDRAA